MPQDKSVEQLLQAIDAYLAAERSGTAASIPNPGLNFTQALADAQQTQQELANRLSREDAITAAIRRGAIANTFTTWFKTQDPADIVSGLTIFFPQLGQRIPIPEETLSLDISSLPLQRDVEQVLPTFYRQEGTHKGNPLVSCALFTADATKHPINSATIVVTRRFDRRTTHLEFFPKGIAHKHQ